MQAHMQPQSPPDVAAFGQLSPGAFAGGTASATTRVIIAEDSKIILDRLNEMIGQIPNVEVVGEVETEVDAVALLQHSRWATGQRFPHDAIYQ